MQDIARMECCLFSLLKARAQGAMMRITFLSVTQNRLAMRRTLVDWFSTVTPLTEVLVYL